MGALLSHLWTIETLTKWLGFLHRRSSWEYRSRLFATGELLAGWFVVPVELFFHIHRYPFVHRRPYAEESCDAGWVQQQSFTGNTATSMLEATYQ